MGDHHHHSGNCSCEHDHSDDQLERGWEFSLYKYIDIDKVRVLNEASKGSKGSSIFKPYHERMSNIGYVQSDADEQLIIHIPFTGNVKIKSIAIYSELGDFSPSKMIAYVNKESVDFDSTEENDQAQEWDLARQDEAVCIEYPTNGVYHLTLFFPTNYGASSTKIFYLGFKGEYFEVSRKPVIAIYEAKPQLSDHKNRLANDVHEAIQ